MKPVIIESPFAGAIEANLKYLGLCVKDCLRRGESPFASHGFFPQWLDDDNPEERKLGIEAGHAWAWAAEKIVYYMDLGMSHGMYYSLEEHARRDREIEVRLLEGEQLPLFFRYKNHRGDEAIRRVKFKRFWWGRTEYHTRPQLMMNAFCLDRNANRDFAVYDAEFMPSAAFKNSL